MHELNQSEWNRPSWVASANDPTCGFPLQSLPHCIFATEQNRPRPGIGIGAHILDLDRCSRSGLLEGLPDSIQKACHARTLNALMACPPAAQAELRRRLTALLDQAADQPTREGVTAALFGRASAQLLKPVEPANYTDFYASIHHARRVGQLFRPDQPLLPNYKHIPIGYHGRASSIVVSGTPIRRPSGQTRPPTPDARPNFGPSQFLDYELEVGLYLAGGNALGEPIPIRDAYDHLFGFSLVNDWSARDIQSWEYQPLGPFLGKSFATSVSPWVVPLAALAPFRYAATLHSPSDPDPLPYLFNAIDQYTGGFHIALEASILTPSMRDAGLAPHVLSQSTLCDLYWTPAQLIAHHTSNGCNLLPGDLLATGTVSGHDESSAGCLLELTRNGARPTQLPNGETRTALEDGDEVMLTGVCRRKGFPDVALGECRGLVLPAL